MKNEEKIVLCAKYLGLELKKRIAFAQVGDRITVPKTCSDKFIYEYCYKLDGVWHLFNPFSCNDSFMLILDKVRIFNLQFIPETELYEFRTSPDNKLITTNASFREGIIDFYLAINQNKDYLKNIIC